MSLKEKDLEFEQQLNGFISEISKSTIEILDLNTVRVNIPRNIHKKIFRLPKDVAEDLKKGVPSDSMDFDEILFSKIPRVDKKNSDFQLIKKKIVENSLPVGDIINNYWLKRAARIIKVVKDLVVEVSPIFDREISYVRGQYISGKKLYNYNPGYCILHFKNLPPIFEDTEYSKKTNQFILFNGEKNAVLTIPLGVSIADLEKIEKRELARRRKKVQRKKDPNP